jgi:hypothetical protein
MEIQHKSFTGIEFKKDKPGSFTARIATLNVIDKDGDVTLPGAFPEGKEILISAYQHGSWLGGLPVGKGMIHADDKEAVVEGQFNLNTETGKEHYETVKFSPELTEWSYGFSILELEENSDWNKNKDVLRVLKRLDVFEASPVLRGAGENTTTLAIKSDTELTFNDEFEAVLATNSKFIERSKGLVALRAAKGKDIPAANKERLSSLLKSLGDLQEIVKTLTVTSESPKTDEAQKLFLQFTKIKSKIMEVV